MWLLLIVVFATPVQSGDPVKFAIPDVWFPSEADCNTHAAFLATELRGDGGHVAFTCFQPPPNGAT
jgi:hypothetical protein